MEVVTTFKAYQDTLIVNVNFGNTPVSRDMAIKIDSFDFTPICSNYFLVGCNLQYNNAYASSLKSKQNPCSINIFVVK